MKKIYLYLCRNPILFFFLILDAVVLAASTGAFHGVMYNPVEPRLVATANAKQGLRLYDVRKPKESVII